MNYALNYVELAVWRILHCLRIRYPENCLLGVYEKTPSARAGEPNRNATVPLRGPMKPTCPLYQPEA